VVAVAFSAAFSSFISGFLALVDLFQIDGQFRGDPPPRLPSRIAGG
jgi:hypothetical protein